MRLCIAICALSLTWMVVASSNKFKVVCYFGSWAVYRTGNGKFDISYIDPTLCTHLIYTFIGITEEGGVESLDEWADLPDGLNGFGKFNALRNNSKAKTLLSIGGWNEGSVKYSTVVSNATLRSNFVTNAVNFVCKYGFNGLDIDWEYPNQRGGAETDLENFALLLKELRASFDKYGLILSISVGAAEGSASLSYDIPAISSYPHFINLMTYDFHVSTESATGHNAPLYAAKSRETTESELRLNTDAATKYWLGQGAPAKKLNIGIPSYGHSFSLSDPEQTSPGSPANGSGIAGPYTQEAGTLGYNEICEMFLNETWTVVYDEEQSVPYAYKDNEWLSFDNNQSVTEKANFIKSNGFGGAMVWSLENDDFRGICGEKYPTLSTINSVLRKNCSSS